jgi:hypothetical protein
VKAQSAPAIAGDLQLDGGTGVGAGKVLVGPVSGSVEIGSAAITTTVMGPLVSSGAGASLRSRILAVCCC